jgi:hemoglobin
MSTDIRTKEDITLLVDRFYDRVIIDPEIGPFFRDLDFVHHKPKMVHFWSFVLLDDTGYTTNVFDKHVHMPLRDQHFDVWIRIFESTVHELFAGEKADTAILRAKTIAWSFKEKFKHMRGNEAK